MHEGSRTGLFVAFEGGEGAGKSTQAGALAQWLRTQGWPVVLTYEPGDTPMGRRLRALLLDPATGALSDRSEVLLYAADKAEHVDTVIAPALRAGQIVVTDRFVDSTLAYQGGGRSLSRAEVQHVAAWATGGLRPDLTVLLDLPPATGIARAGSPDRLEAEPVEFHSRVRACFLDLAAADPGGYLVVDGTRAASVITREVRQRVASLLSSNRGDIAEMRRAES